MTRWTTAFIDRPAVGWEASCNFWLAVTGTTLSSPRGEHDEFATLLPDVGDACLRIQRTSDGSAGSHLDLHVDDVPAGAARAVDLGARVIDDRDSLVVLRSPGGLNFCVVSHRGESVRPRPVGPPGARTLVDQICIDIAPDRFDDECRFWAAVTGWELRAGGEPEFAVLARPVDQPHRFLLQRRGEGDAGVDATCHLDLACDDVDASVAAHVDAGAALVARFRWWTVMTDPAGVEYCLTRRNPDTGLHA